MKTVKNFKVGQKIKHWCSGCIVEGEIIEINENANCFFTIHEPIRWGNDIYTKTRIYWNYVQDNWTPGIIV